LKLDRGKQKKINKKKQNEKTKMSCLDTITDIEPIIYLKGYQIVFFGKLGKSLPVAVKFSSKFNDDQMETMFVLRKFTLEKTCPNIVKRFCFSNHSTGDIYDWMMKNKDYFFNQDENKKVLSILASLQKEYIAVSVSVGDYPGNKEETKKKIKTEYDEKKKLVNQFNNFDKYVSMLRFKDSILSVSVFERIASPYTLDYLIKSELHTLTLDNFLAISFQLFSFVHGIRQLGLSHQDFVTRNTWLQPIKSNYKYLAYPSPQVNVSGRQGDNTDNILHGNNNDNILDNNLRSSSGRSQRSHWYLPLKDSFNFILKIGDYGETKSLTKLREESKVKNEKEKENNLCNDILLLGQHLLKLHKNCPDCGDVLMTVINCLENCSNTLGPLNFPGLSSYSSCQINPFEFPIFSDKYSSVPKDLTIENVVTPDLYFDYQIVNPIFLGNQEEEKKEEKKEER
jgi:hypothetical protein